MHVSPQQLKTAFQGALQDQLNAAVKAGKLTQSQANVIEKGIRAGGLPPVPFFGPRVLGKGKSLAHIATAHGKTVSGLENAMVAAERSRLDRARAQGLITSSQEQRLLSRLQQKIGALVSRAGFAGRLFPLMGPRPFFGPRMVPGPRRFFGPRMVPPGFVPPAGLPPAGPPPLG